MKYIDMWKTHRKLVKLNKIVESMIREINE